MSEFDTIAMVDWSGAPDRGATPKADAIWICVAREGHAGPPAYHRSPEAATGWLADFAEAEAATGRRVLLGFDFPFGYPAGLAARITGTDDPRALWDRFADAFAGLAPGEGRFDIAARINAMLPGEGPFWFNGLRREIAHLPRRKPLPPDWIAPRRAVEDMAPGSFACWQMGGTGAVGSQAMTGMAALARLRQRLGAGLAVWPFDDGAAPVLAVEIWPSLLREVVARRMAGDADLPRGPKGPIKDAAQVVVLAEALVEAQRRGDLATLLDAPPDEARREEGWILGVGADVSLSDDDTALAPPPLRDDCFALPAGVNWTPVNEALALLRDRLAPVTGVETVATAKADGRILARDAIARRSNPPAANAAVDGYGFAHAATGEGSQTLPVVAGRAAAGVPHDTAVSEGHALRILTGALLPEGVDTVVLEEDTRAGGGRIAFNGPVKRGANTRRAGEDVAAGACALVSGHVLRPPDLALMTALGLAVLPVRRRLRVGVLSTGDELAAPGETEDPVRTYDANRPMLLALAARWGHAAVDLGQVGDDRAALRERLDRAAREADVLLTSGGASAGDEDHVSALLGETGSLTAWRIAVKPGRPLALAMWRGMPVFGLPGNPVAAFVCALIFARPALARLAGAPWPEPLAITLPAAFAKSKKPGRREYMRARIGADGRAERFASEGSGRISGLSWAEGLVELEDGAREIAPGDPVRFLPYAGFGI